MTQKVKLISLDGCVTFEAVTHHHPRAIIFADRVFLFAQEVATQKHYREIASERITEWDSLASHPPHQTSNGEKQ